MTGAIKKKLSRQLGCSYRGGSSEGQGIQGSPGHSIVELAQEMLMIWEASSGAEIALILLATSINESGHFRSNTPEISSQRYGALKA